MKRALRVFFWLLMGLALAGFIGLFVNAICDSTVRQHGFSMRDPISGHVIPIDTHRGRNDPHVTLYVTHDYQLTSKISEYIAVIGIGLPAIIVLLGMTGNLIRLLLPPSFLPANLELARYRSTVGENGITEEGLRYVAAWRDLKRRKLSPVLIIGSMVAFVAYVLVFTSSSSIPAQPLYLSRSLLILGFAAWALGALVLGLYLCAFKCPRCNERFAQNWGRSYLGFCTQCGLPEYSPPTTEVSPQFLEWKKLNSF
jgi:hypothetical protein